MNIGYIMNRSLQIHVCTKLYIYAKLHNIIILKFNDSLLANVKKSLCSNYVCLPTFACMPIKSFREKL